MSDRMARTRLTSSSPSGASKSEAPAGNYTVWPAREGLRRANKRFSLDLKGEYTAHRFIWNSSGVTFQSLNGRRDDSANQFAGWLYQPQEPASYVPQKAMPVRINLWLFQGRSPGNGQLVELIVHSFKYTPTPIIE
jgi:hypothetical protein